MLCESRELKLPLVYQSLSLRQGRTPRAPSNDAPKNGREKKTTNGDGHSYNDYSEMMRTTACYVTGEMSEGALSDYGGSREIRAVVVEVHVEMEKEWRVERTVLPGHRTQNDKL